MVDLSDKTAFKSQVLPVSFPFLGLFVESGLLGHLFPKVSRVDFDVIKAYSEFLPHNAPPITPVTFYRSASPCS